MTQTISAFIRDMAVLDEAVQFLVTEYGMQDADIRIEPDRDEAGTTTLSVDVNDDEAGEIRSALAAIGAVLEARE